jgi:hypothetical protein
MGFLDKAKKVAEQAKEMAGQAKEYAEDALADAQAKRQSTAGAGSSAPASAPEYGTPYVEGMLGRPGWREQRLADPAAVLPVDARDRVGVPRSTKSEVIEEPYGMGRRWSAAGRSAALLYQLYPEQQTWAPPGGTAPLPEINGASVAKRDDGSSLVFLSSQGRRVVLAVTGIDDGERANLARTIMTKLAES